MVRQPTETVAIRGTVDDAAVGLVFDDLRLPWPSAESRSPSTSYFQPTKSASANHSRRLAMIFGVGLSSSSMSPSRVLMFARVQRLELAVVGPSKNLANGKVTHGGGVKHRARAWLRPGQALQFFSQVCCGCKLLKLNAFRHLCVGGRAAAQQCHLVAVGGQALGQAGAKLAGRVVGQPANLVDWLVGRAGGDNAVHGACRLAKRRRLR